MTLKNERTQSGLSGPVLALLYLFLALGPVLLVVLFGGGMRSGHSIAPLLGRAFGGVALSMMLLQFVTSGRFEMISGRIGLDHTMAFHRLAAVSVLLLIILHVLGFAMRQPDQMPVEILMRFAGYILNSRFLTGSLAALFLMVIVGVGKYCRRDFPYPVWRISHGVLAVLAVVLAIGHGVSHARLFAGGAGMAMFAVLVVLAAGSVVVVYIWRPVMAFRHGFRVERVRQLSPTIADLTLIAPTGTRFDFAAGQFCWITRNGHHTVTDNPFSMASISSDLPRLRFLIRNAGDMSGSVAGLTPGTLMGVDGPHGNFTLNASQDGPVLLLAGGIGVAPILGLLRALATSGDRRPVRVLVAAKTAEDHVVRDEILAFAQQLDLQVIFLVEQDAGASSGFEAGMCKGAHIARLIGDDDPAQVTACVCGPSAMMDHVTGLLLRAGVLADHIITERFDFDAATDPVSRKAKWRFVGILTVIFMATALIVVAGAG
ncbi:MAG: ferric reductase-like transmembrane domain-containing protein [Pseudomonadota bacterium]